MARYSIYDGGNHRNLPWESDRTSGIDPSYPVRYAAHLTNFHKVLRYHIDLNNEVFREWLDNAVPGGRINAGDELVTQLYGPGTRIKEVVMQVKSVPPTVGEGGNPAPTPPTLALEIQGADGSVVHALGNVLMNEIGFYTFPLSDVFLGTNGFLSARLVSGDLSYSCFSLMTDLVQFIDPTPCSCRKACGADFPDPNCPPPGLVGGDTGGDVFPPDAGERVQIRATLTMPDGDSGSPYAGGQAEGHDGTAPYTYALVSGTLPPGLTLDVTTGEITGTPIYGGGGAFTITVRATDVGGHSAEATDTFNISGS